VATTIHHKEEEETKGRPIQEKRRHRDTLERSHQHFYESSYRTRGRSAWSGKGKKGPSNANQVRLGATEGGGEKQRKKASDSARKKSIPLVSLPKGFRGRDLTGGGKRIP